LKPVPEEEEKFNMRQAIRVPTFIESKIPKLSLNRSSSNISAGPQTQMSQSINLTNLKSTVKSKSSKYEDNVDECQRLAEYISENMRFILCFGQNKDGELGIPSKD
jgi:ubiquitin